MELKNPESFEKSSILRENPHVAKKQKLDQTKIPQMPDEIWLKILNLMESQDIFANFALVCKRFHNLTLDSRAVKTINLIEIKTLEQYESARKVLKQSKNLYKVKIRNCPKYYNTFITEAFTSN